MEYEEIKFIVRLFIIIIAMLGFFISIIMNNKKRKRNINFDEFDDIEKIKQQEIKDKQKMEYETRVLEHVYEDTYNKYSTSKSLGLYAHIKAQEELEKARRDLYNFNVLDSIEVRKEAIKEAGTIKSFRENGNKFDIELFKKWSRQICGCIKLGTQEQLKVVKNCMSDELFNRLEFQIKEFAKDGLEFVTEDFIIENCKLFDYGKRLGQEEIQIVIEAKMKEYIIRKSDNVIIKGSKDKYFNKTILMTFIKKKEETQEGLMHNCPNCGAQIIQTDFGNCRYCQTLIFPIRYNWTLVKFETI